MNKILPSTLLFSPLLAAAGHPSSIAPRRKAPPETLICQDAGLAALDNELSALIPGDCRVLPEQQKTERAIQRGWIRGATTAGRRATCASAWKRAARYGSPGCRSGRPAEGCRRRWTTSAASTSPSPPTSTNEAKRPAAMINLSGGTASSRCSPAARPQRQRRPPRRGKTSPSGTRGSDARLERHGQPPSPATDPGQLIPARPGAGQHPHFRTGSKRVTNGWPLAPFSIPLPPLANPARAPGFSGWRPFVDLARQFAISSFPLRSRAVNIATGNIRLVQGVSHEPCQPSRR